MKSLIAPTLLLLACLLCSCHGPARSRAESAQEDTAQIGTELAGIKVSVARLAPMTRTVRMMGQVSPTETGKVDVTTPLNGMILEAPIRIGDRVRKGEPIAVINSIYGQTSLQLLQKIESDKEALSQAQDNKSQADAELANADINLKRERLLFRGGVAARTDVENAEERFQKAQAVERDAFELLKIARATLDRDRILFHHSYLSGSELPQNLTPVPLGAQEKYPAAPGSVLFYVRAPISGTITADAMSIGSTVGPGTVLATLTNTDQVYVDANAYESDLPFVHRGDAVTVSAAAFPGMKFSGRVRYVADQVDPATRTVVVRSAIRNPSGTLRPGMFVTVLLTTHHPKTALVVPEAAVLIHGTGRYVFVQTGPDHFVKRPVTVGLSGGGMVEIRNGLKAGEKVVTSGNLLLEGEE